MLLKYKKKIERPYKDFSNEELIKALLGEGKVEVYGTTYVLHLDSKVKDPGKEVWQIEDELLERGIFILAIWVNKVEQKVPFLYRYKKGHLYYKTGRVSVRGTGNTREERRADALRELKEMGFDSGIGELYWNTLTNY